MAASTQTRWTLDVSKSVDESLRGYLRDSGDATPEAVARFVEDAVQTRLFDLNVQKIKDAFLDMSPAEIDKLADEAISWARSPEGRHCE
ncbi:MAG TPA: ribbon-helix-helix domain-containing protein [Acidobacteriaceae bacterium]